MPPSTLSITSFLILLLSFFTTIDARKSFGFLYLCIGDGCTSGQIGLMILTIVVFFLICCVPSAYCCLYRLCCNGNGGEGIEGRQTENKDMDNENDINTRGIV